MNNSIQHRKGERGGAGIKLLLVFLLLFLIGHAGYNYVPIAYEGASFRSDMDTAVVKGLAASGQIKPLDTVKATITHSMASNNVPADAIVDIKPVKGVVQAHVAYTKPVKILPFGIYTYTYSFDYTAVPVGYLTEE
jgi:hypothetical protein